MTIINEPQFWRMQLHPALSGKKAQAATDQCLDQRRIGLDFEDDNVGDLRSISRSDLKKQKNYYDFCELMEIGDIVLISLSNAPYALVRVVGEYKYSTDPDRAGLWCSHHRKVDVLAYYDAACEDRLPKATLPTTKALQPINPKGTFYRFVQAWVGLTA